MAGIDRSLWQILLPRCWCFGTRRGVSADSKCVLTAPCLSNSGRVGRKATPDPNDCWRVGSGSFAESLHGLAHRVADQVVGLGVAVPVVALPRRATPPACRQKSRVPTQTRRCPELGHTRPRRPAPSSATAPAGAFPRCAAHAASRRSRTAVPWRPRSLRTSRMKLAMFFSYSSLNAWLMRSFQPWCQPNPASS